MLKIKLPKQDPPKSIGAKVLDAKILSVRVLSAEIHNAKRLSAEILSSRKTRGAYQSLNIFAPSGTTTAPWQSAGLYSPLNPLLQNRPASWTLKNVDNSN